MRSLKVRQQTPPRVGEGFELDSDAGDTISVVSHRSGQRSLTIRRPGDDEPWPGASLSRHEAAALAALHTGAIIEVTTVPMA